MALGGVLRDAIHALAQQGAFGEALNTPATSYSVVFHVEIYLLFVVLVALGPLVRRQARMAPQAARTSSQPFGLAELPG